KMEETCLLLLYEGTDLIDPVSTRESSTGCSTSLFQKISDKSKSEVSTCSFGTNEILLSHNTSYPIKIIRQEK
ncbi:hypothetical protein L9F63_011573, partial [Diploptera punctata]